MTMPNGAPSTETRVRAQQAKEYLIAQLLDQAKRENVPLTELERKMLYFTESYDPPPDIMEVNEKFERDYDRVAYEKKIAALLHNARERIKKQSPEAAARWKQAVADLVQEDHYLEIMLFQSLRSPANSWSRVAWATALGMIVSMLVALELARDPQGTEAARRFRWILASFSHAPITRQSKLFLLAVGAGASVLVFFLASRPGLRNFAKGIRAGMRAGFSREREKTDRRNDAPRNTPPPA